MNSPSILIGSFVLGCFLSTPGLTQQPTPTPQPQPSPEKQAEQAPAGANAQQQPAGADQEREKQKEEQSQRILGVVPQFSVTSRQHPAPLTPGQKFHLFARSTFDPFAFAAAGLQAGIGQATNEFPGYGQGAAGYGKRYGASFADATSSGFFSNFAYPTLLKEDPRYFRLGEGSIKHRIFYSLAQEFVTHTDKGTRRFNFSNVLGAFSSGGLSNVYYPQSDRGFGLTMSRSAISLAYGAAGGLIDEFWIDIDKKLFHHKPKQSQQTKTDTTTDKK
ncbi:MAG TPA: hypothetical protein VKE93_03830 [Candidatus Angelobacter sp.]|nr:hypothetical protein [Candidatus Angelobacter sp.]